MQAGDILTLCKQRKTHIPCGLWRTPSSCCCLPRPRPNPESLHYIIWVAVVVDIERHPQIPLQGWTYCPVVGGPVSRQPPAVSSSRVCVSCREKPFPRWYLPCGNPHLVTEWGRWSFWSDVGYSVENTLSLALPARLAKVCQACITVWFPSLPILLPAPYFYRCQALINTMHPKLCLNACFWRAQSVTAMKLSDDDNSCYWGCGHVVWFLWSGFLPTIWVS